MNIVETPADEDGRVLAGLMFLPVESLGPILVGPSGAIGLWVDEIHFASPKKPWNDSIPL